MFGRRQMDLHWEFVMFGRFWPFILRVRSIHFSQNVKTIMKLSMIDVSKLERKFHGHAY